MAFSLRTLEAAMLNVKKVAPAFLLGSALLAVFLVAANAMPSPYAERSNVLPDFNSDITTLAIKESSAENAMLPRQAAQQSETTGIGTTAEERALFEAPRVQHKTAPRCSVNSIVFAKITLAQACF
jgi:hypothetical protein